ncbi:EF-hand domain-containing protein [Sphingomonas sp. WKB10]|nr:EF-hand domain-containing protein [Sphingomonas sp. WKB10]
MIRTALVILPLLIATPALAAGKADPKAAAKIDPRIKADFDKTDTNHDGFISRAEVDARVARMDVGKTQMPAAKAKAMADAWFNTADANHDGKVSPAEMQGLFRAIASRYDLNHDGVISLDERAAARAAVMGGPAKALPQGGNPLSSHPGLDPGSRFLRSSDTAGPRLKAGVTEEERGAKRRVTARATPARPRPYSPARSVAPSGCG